MQCLDLRSYPTGLGVAIHKVYQAALQGKALAPLRFAIYIDKQKTPAQIFEELPLNDCWMDANMPSVFEYMYNCKYVRTCVMHVRTCVQSFLQRVIPPTYMSRIPAEFQPAMRAFRAELQAQASRLHQSCSRQNAQIQRASFPYMPHLRWTATPGKMESCSHSPSFRVCSKAIWIARASLAEFGLYIAFFKAFRSFFGDFGLPRKIRAEIESATRAQISATRAQITTTGRKYKKCSFDPQS